MPTLEIRPFADNVDNADILNAIRSVGSLDYQRRVTEATQAGITTNLQQLTENRPLWNEFVGALINRVGDVVARNNSWTNKLAKFKRGMLQYGDTIEEINVGLIKSHSYNPKREYLERDIFGNYPPEVQSSFHKINRREFYPLTINESLLQHAFLESGGLSSFVTNVMSAPTTSDQWDEWLATVALFREYYDAEGFYEVQIGDIAASEANAKAFLKQVRALTGTLQFMSTAYNAAGMPIAVDADELELFTTPEALAAMDVDALAAAFNIDRASVSARITLVPAENFNIPGAQAILTTKDFFVIADNKIETSSVWNPVALSNNMFLHHWQVISASRFVPAILFTTQPSRTALKTLSRDVTGITAVTVADNEGTVVTDVIRGDSYQLVGNAITAAGPDAVYFEIDGRLSTHTYINTNGTLVVGIDEEAESLTITMFAVHDEAPRDVSSTITVTVSGERAVFWPNPAVEADGTVAP